MNAHAAARDEVLRRVTDGLSAAADVVGVALVGSLGTRRADDWSDVDLLVYVDGEVAGALDEVIADAGVASVLTSPHNTRADGHSFGAVFLVDGLPILTDWYVWPAEHAAWPRDATPITSARRAFPIGGAFLDMNGVGPRGEMPAATDERLRHHTIAMTVIDAKRLARGATDVDPGALIARLDPHRAAAPELVAAAERYVELAIRSACA